MKSFKLSNFLSVVICILATFNSGICVKFEIISEIDLDSLSSVDPSSEPPIDFEEYRPIGVVLFGNADSDVANMAMEYFKNLKEKYKEYQVNKNSVAESLEYLVDYYKKGIDIEDKVSYQIRLFRKLKAAPESTPEWQQFRVKLSELNEKLDDLIMLREEGSIGTQSYIDALTKLSRDKKKAFTELKMELQRLDDEGGGEKINDTILDERKDIQGEAMYYLLEEMNTARHHVNKLESKIGIKTYKLDLINSFDDDCQHVPKVTVDMVLFEKLIQNYGRLELLKRDLEGETDEERIELMEQAISYLEDEIPNTLRKNTSKLRKYGEAFISSTIRIMRMVKMLQDLVTEVKEKEAFAEELATDQVLSSKLFDQRIKQAAKIRPPLNSEYSDHDEF